MAMKESFTLTQEFNRILVRYFLDKLLAVAPLLHFETQLGHQKRVAVAPVGCRVYPDAVGAVNFDYVGCALRRALGVGIDSQARPVAAVEYLRDRVLFGVVDEDPVRVDAAVGLDCVHD